MPVRIGACQTPEILGDVDRALVISAGRVVGRYRKTYLVPGEAVFTPGEGYPVFDRGGVRFGINICYDLQFPAAAAAVAAAGARVLLAPTQNMMPRDRALWWQHRHSEIGARRARETGLWPVTADVTGERDGTRSGSVRRAWSAPTGGWSTGYPPARPAWSSSAFRGPHRTDGGRPGGASSPGRAGRPS